jgi:hypothetical protein
MSDKIHYLSDEELNKLIADVESEGLCEAPADLEDKVIYTLVERQKKKTVSFAEYCFRVGFGVVAAIALLAVVPSVSGNIPTRDAVPTREEVLSGRHTPTREEVLMETSQPSYFDAAKQYINSHLSDLFE